MKELKFKNRFLLIHLTLMALLTFLEVIFLIIGNFAYLSISILSVTISIAFLLISIYFKIKYKKEFNTIVVFIILIVLLIQVNSTLMHLKFSYIYALMPKYRLDVNLISPFVIKIVQNEWDLNNLVIIGTKDFYYPYLNICIVFIELIVVFILIKKRIINFR